MITPSVEVEVFTRNANAVAYASDNDTMGAGKTAYEQLTHKADVVYNVEALDGVPPMTYIVPYRSAVQGTVARSTIESEDPVDALCKPEEGGGSALGLWQFNETISLAPMGTEWNVTWTVAGVNGESIKFDHYSQQGVDADAFQLCSSAIGMCLPAYVDGTGWGAGGRPVIEFTGGDDIENPDFVAWLNANATRSEPETVSGCWRFNDEVPTSNELVINGEFTSNGQTFTNIIISNESIYYGDGLEASVVVYEYSMETYRFEWTNAAYKDICFTGETSLDPALAQWLNDNATKVS